MKKLTSILSLLTAILLSSAVFAQTANLPESPVPQDSRSTQLPFFSGTNQSAAQSTSKPPKQVADDERTSQAGPFPRFPRGPVIPPRERAYRYPSAFRPGPPPLSPMGALVGLGIGGTLGAIASGDHTPRGRLAGGLIGGGICALIGGAIGSAFSLMPSRNFHNRSSDDRDEEAGHRRRRRISPAVHASDNDPDIEASAAPNPVQPSE